MLLCATPLTLVFNIALTRISEVPQQAAEAVRGDALEVAPFTPGPISDQA